MNLTVRADTAAGQGPRLAGGPGSLGCCVAFSAPCPALLRPPRPVQPGNRASGTRRLLPPGPAAVSLQSAGTGSLPRPQNTGVQDENSESRVPGPTLSESQVSEEDPYQQGNQAQRYGPSVCRRDQPRMRAGRRGCGSNGRCTEGPGHGAEELGLRVAGVTEKLWGRSLTVQPIGEDIK